MKEAAVGAATVKTKLSGELTFSIQGQKQTTSLQQELTINSRILNESPSVESQAPPAVPDNSSRRTDILPSFPPGRKERF